MHTACSFNRVNIVNLLINICDNLYKGKNIPVDWNEALEAACRRGNIRLIELMLKKCKDNKVVIDWNNALFRTCGTDIINVKLILNEWSANYVTHKCKLDWNKGFLNACDYRDTNIMQLIIQYCVTYDNIIFDWNAGLSNICSKMYMYLYPHAKKFMKQLFNAMTYIISKGATQCSHCLLSIKDHLNPLTFCMNYNINRTPTVGSMDMY
jgi:hypothetical protein